MVGSKLDTDPVLFREVPGAVVGKSDDVPQVKEHRIGEDLGSGSKREIRNSSRAERRVATEVV